jgi:DNA-binding SARP family transcriptional activator
MTGSTPSATATADRVSEALARAADAAEAAGDLGAAIARTRRRIAVDPLAEDAHRALIRRLAATGDRAAALAAYAHLRELLRRELAIEPSARCASWSLGFAAKRCRCRRRWRGGTAAPLWVAHGPSPT